jgi:hypothetical protein
MQKLRMIDGSVEPGCGAFLRLTDCFREYDGGVGPFFHAGHGWPNRRRRRERAPGGGR